MGYKNRRNRSFRFHTPLFVDKVLISMLNYITIKLLQQHVLLHFLNTQSAQ